MKLISYSTWRKHNPGYPLCDGYKFCGALPTKNSYPKDIATLIIHSLFSKEEEDVYEFIYWPHTYKNKKCVEKCVEVWCRKIK